MPASVSLAGGWSFSCLLIQMWDIYHVSSWQKCLILKPKTLQNNNDILLYPCAFTLTVGNIWCWTSGLPAGGHYQHHCTEGSAPCSQTRAVQSYWGSSRYTDETLEPAAIQLCSPQEEAAGGSRTLQKGKNTHLTQHWCLSFSHPIQISLLQYPKQKSNP